MQGVDATLHVGERTFAVRRLDGREAIGELFRFRVQTSGEHDPIDAFLGKPCTLDLHTTVDEDDVRIDAIVVAAESTYEHGDQILVFELGPAVEVLAHGQGSHVHLDKDAKAIIEATFSRAAVVAPTITTSGALPKRTYTVQHRESDWEFVRRLAHEEGLYSVFLHDGGTKLHFVADSTGAPKASKKLFLREQGGLVATAPWVLGIRERAVATSNAVRLRDRDAEKPKLVLEAAEEHERSNHEVYEWPGRFAVVGDGKARATSMLDALRARRVVVSGRTNSLLVRPGTIFEVDSGSDPRTLFCVSVEIEASDAPFGDAGTGTEGTFEMRFTAVAADVHYREAWTPAVRAPLGAETAIVCGASGQEIDADTTARVFAQPMWDREGKKDDTSTTRARVGQAALGRSMAIPRIGWSVLTGTFEGDADRPWVVARLVTGKAPVPYALPANATRTAWQSLTSPGGSDFSEILFEDKSDAEQLNVTAARDLHVAIGDNEARTVGNRHALTVEKDQTQTVDADRKVTIAKDQQTTVKGAESLEVDGSRSITVKGKESITVSGSRTENVTKDLTLDVGKDRKLTVAAGMTAKAKKGITREVLKKVTTTAGGGWTTQADGGLVMETKGDGSETVGGAYSITGKAGIQTLVKGNLSETVGAAQVVTAQGSASESAKGKMKLTVGAAMSATAPGIEIVAESEITIACGGSTITIKSGEVSIKAPLVSATGPMVASDGATVKHNP